MARTDHFLALFSVAVLALCYAGAAQIPKSGFFWIPTLVYVYAAAVAFLYRRTMPEKMRCWLIAGSFAILFIAGGQVLILEQGIPTRWLDWGRFPTHDAADFLTNSHAVLTDGGFTSIRGRPMANALLSSLWRLAGFDLALLGWMISGLCAVALTVFGAASLRTFGIAVGVIPIALAVDFGHEHLGAVSTEPIGFATGLIAAAFLLRAARKPTLPAYAMGLFTLGLAFFLRAGAMFVLPFLLLWPFLLFSGRRAQWQAAILGVVALAVVALVHIAVSRTLTPNSPSFVNAPKSWYAIIAMGDEARGLRADRPVRKEARWLQIFDDHPGLHGQPIAEQGRRFIKILTENALDRPLSVLVGAGVEYADQIGRAGLFRFIDNKAIRTVAFLLFVLGSIVAVWRWRRDPLSALLLYVGAGILLSIPFLHGGENRVHAATIGLMGALAALSVHRMSARWRSPEPLGDSGLPFLSPTIFASTVMCLVLVGAYPLAGSLPKAAVNCGAAGHKAIWRAGSSVAVSRPSLGWRGLSFLDGAAVKTTIQDWQTIAEGSGAFFYAPIDADLIRRTNDDLIAVPGPGALVLAVDAADGSLRREWISDEKINRDGTFCLSDKAG
ncbi:MAG: hypothetical protein ACPGQV_18400 [Alphaproteobacteria bacterium]